MLAGAQDLSADGDDAISCHRARHPLVARAIDRDRGVERQVGGERSPAKALERCRHPHLLVGPLGVVFVHPSVELFLEILERGEGALGDELAAKRVVPALDLAGRGGARGLGESVRDPVFPADLVEEHLGVVSAEASGEDLAVEFLSDVKSQFGLS